MNGEKKTMDNKELKQQFKSNGGIVRNEDVQSFVALRDVNKIYPNGIQAVYDFNIEINQHDFIVLVGPSGCGKSTTLRMVAGLEDITSGSLYIDKVLSNYVPSKNRDISMVFQSYALYPQMTVYDNIAFPLKARKYDKIRKAENTIIRNELPLFFDQADKTIEGMNEAKDRKLNWSSASVYLSTKMKTSEKSASFLLKHNFTTKEELLNLKDDMMNEINALAEKENIEYAKKNQKVLEDGIVVDEQGSPVHFKAKLIKEEIRQKVFEAASILDLGPYLDRRPKELSGGQMQRVALGRAIVRNAKVFLMDEPLSNLDAKLRVQMRSEIVRLHEKIGATTIYVTHDQTEAMTMATRIAVMSKGWVQQIGEPQVIYSHPDNIFVATFIGSPAMNIFDGEYENGKVFFHDGYSVDLGEGYKKIHDDFYHSKVAQMKEFLEKDPVKKMHGLALHDEIKPIDEESRIPLEKQLGHLETQIRKIAENRKPSNAAEIVAVCDEKTTDHLAKMGKIKTALGELASDEAIRPLLEKADILLKDKDSYYQNILDAKMAELKAVCDTVKDEDHDALMACFTADANKPVTIADILAKLKPLLLNITDITAKELSVLHNAQAFSKDKKKEADEVLFYNKRRGKAKKAVKGYKAALHIKDSNLILTNNLYVVLTDLLHKYEACLEGRHDIRIGIRPEHIHLDNEYTNPHKTAAFETETDVVELLGSELLVHSEWNDVDMIAKISTGTLVKGHEHIQLSFNADKVLVFDVNSGDTVASWNI